MSEYRISIVRADQRPVLLVPGSLGERDLVDAIVEKLTCLNADRITAELSGHGVGVFRSEAKVLAALRAVLGDTKADARYAIESVLRELKGEVHLTR